MANHARPKSGNGSAKNDRPGETQGTAFALAGRMNPAPARWHRLPSYPRLDWAARPFASEHGAPSTCAMSPYTPTIGRPDVTTGAPFAHSDELRVESCGNGCLARVGSDVSRSRTTSYELDATDSRNFRARRWLSVHPT